MKFYESGAALAQDMGVPKILMEGRTPLTRAVSHWMKPLARQAQERSSTTTLFLGGTFTSGLRGLRPRGRRSMCQIRVGRQCEGHFSRDAFRWIGCKKRWARGIQKDFGSGLRSATYYVVTSRQSSNTGYSGP